MDACEKEVRIILKKNIISYVEDGRVQIEFAKPIPEDRAGGLILLGLGMWKGSEIMVKNKKIIGVRCQPEAWIGFLETLGVSKKHINEVKEIIDELFEKYGKDLLHGGKGGNING